MAKTVMVCNLSSFLCYRREPGTGSFCPCAALEYGRPDVIDGPPIPEAVLYLSFGYPPRTVAGGLQVGKAEHEVVPARGQDGGKSIHKERAVFIGQGMEEPGIGRSIELPVEL